jgi:hypothetical protein
MADDPSEQRRGRLKHGNPPGDLSTALRCGGQDTARYRLSLAGHAERSMSASWGREYRPEDR